MTAFTPDDFVTELPSGGGGEFEVKDHLGALVIFKVLEDVGQMDTVHGASNPVRVNVTVVDGPHAGSEHDDALIFGKVMSNQLRKLVGQTVLGRIGQGEKKPGKNAPWLLQPATSEDITKAKAHVAAQSDVPF